MLTPDTERRAVERPDRAEGRGAGPRAKLRVLLISHTCLSRTEGQPKAQQLAQSPDIDLHVLVPDRWFEYGRWRAAETPEQADYALQVGKVIWPWAGPAQWYLHWYPCLLKTLLDFRPDVIDLWEEPWGLVSVLTCFLRNRLLPNTRIVAETEQNINKSLPFPFEQFRAYTLRNADFAVGRSAEAVAVLRDKGYAGPAEAVPNAVDAALFRPMDRAECRAKLGLTGFVVGYIGRLVEEKGLTDLVDAVALCPPSTQLVFVGAGPLQAALERRVQEAGLQGRARFLPQQPLRVLPEIMNALDAFVLPSWTTSSWKEQFGRVIIEASACRVPVIGTDSGAIPEVVGGAGLIVPERDPQALAGAIRELAGDPARRARMGRRGRAQVEARYSWERVAGRMRGIYGRVRPARQQS